MSMVIPLTPPEDKVKDLIARGMVVEREALEHLAKEFDAARDALETVKKFETETRRALVIMDPDEDALVVLWRAEDESSPSAVS